MCYPGERVDKLLGRGEPETITIGTKEVGHCPRCGHPFKLRFKNEKEEYDFAFNTYTKTLDIRGLCFDDVKEFSLKCVDGKYLVTVINDSVCRFEL